MQIQVGTFFGSDKVSSQILHNFWRNMRPRRQLMENTYDIVIVGAGPAGMTAAIYAIRANMNGASSIEMEA